MSDENKNDMMSCCASCGIAEVDDIKLKDCDDGCDLVKYCSDECRELHRSEHAEECKQRAAELRDELLFKHTKSTHLGDCPICMIPLPLDKSKSWLMSCCSKFICNGCFYADTKRTARGRRQYTCPFCREPFIMTDEERGKLVMKRIEANDPVALYEEGGKHLHKGDYESAFEYWTKAAEVGDVEAHYGLSILYQHGKGVDKDEGKEIHHLEEAVIGSHPVARYNLGCIEWNNGDKKKALMHYIIAAAQGENKSTKALMDFFKLGVFEKDVLDVALRAHKAAINATKSPQRKVADKLEGRVVIVRKK